MKCMYSHEGGAYCDKHDHGAVTVGCCGDESCPDRKFLTNVDRIRAMSDEELAEWLADILNHCDNKKPEELCRISCPLYKCCNDQPSDNIEDWLKAPVEDLEK